MLMGASVISQLRNNVVNPLKQPGGWETALAVEHVLEKKRAWRCGAVSIL